jgi:hypothetical protein
MTTRCNEHGLNASEIWKLEEEKLATPDEINWRKRDDALTGTVRPEPPGPDYVPLTPTEFFEATGGSASVFSGPTPYEEYLKGFYRELGRSHCHQKRVERDARSS